MVLYCTSRSVWSIDTLYMYMYMQEHHLDDELMSLALLSSQEDKKEAAM